MDSTPHIARRDFADRRDDEIVDRFSGQTHARPAREPVTPVLCGSGWYHDAAIEQAARSVIEARCNPYG